MIRITLKDFTAIHEANYTDNAEADRLFRAIVADAKGPHSHIDHHPLFADYCDATE